MIDYNDLRLMIQIMTRKSPIYKVLKKELSRLGYWKNKPRGDSSKGGKARKYGNDQ